MAAALRALHVSHGVDIIEGVLPERIEGAGRAEAVRLAGGRVLAADVVVVGIGVVPQTALAAGAGIAVENGIATDAFGRSSAPGIWAAGDCASFPAPGGGRMRLESVGGAIDMAEAVAADMLGQGAPYVPRPWFWSDQFEAKLQIAGLPGGAERVVRQGEGFSVWSFDGPRLACVEALDDARAYMVGKRLIEAGRAPDPAALADPATDLKSLLR